MLQFVPLMHLIGNCSSVSIWLFLLVNLSYHLSKRPEGRGGVVIMRAALLRDCDSVCELQNPSCEVQILPTGSLSPRKRSACTCLDRIARILRSLHWVIVYIWISQEHWKQELANRQLYIYTTLDWLILLYRGNTTGLCSCNIAIQNATEDGSR